MTRDVLYRYFDQHYLPKRDMLPRIPLGTDPDEFWQEIQGRRRSRAQMLPLHGSGGIPYWYVTTDKMIAASELIVEELMEENNAGGPPVLAPLEEAFYTSYVEGSPMAYQTAMDYLHSEKGPRDIEEQMVENNRMALQEAVRNLYYPVSENYLKDLAGILTENMDGGGREYRTADMPGIPFMMDEPYDLPSAVSVPECIRELVSYLSDPSVHPLVKAAVAQAWILVVRPFYEGSERLARIISNVILIRAGYGFFGEVSLSALIAKDGFKYYNALANIIRAENEGDLTYFVEYYIMLLAEAVEDRRKKKVEAIKTEQELARQALQSVPSPSPPLNNNTPQQETNNNNITQETKNNNNTPPSETDISASLAEDGFVNLADLAEESPGQWPADKGGGKWVCEERVREVLESIVMNNTGSVMPRVAGLLLQFLEDRKYEFTSGDLARELAINRDSVSKRLYKLRGQGILEPASEYPYLVYTFSNPGPELDVQDYSEEILHALDDLAFSNSQKDRRISAVIRKYLPLGYIPYKEYEDSDGESKWKADMRLAELMGIVRRVSKDRCHIMQDLQPRPECLDSKLKRRARLMYESFGSDTFSREMVIATLDYSESAASACLHQFTLLKILDCKKEGTVIYRFRVNPVEHPEIFEETA